MARFVGTADHDVITPATISPGVDITPAGADLLGDDRILSLSGNDRVEGDSGDDVAFLGNGNDRFIWNPGDGDDIFNGGSGTDTLEFNGSDDAELMTVTTLDNGGFRFFRNLGDITVDTRLVERVEVNALGGNDIINASGQTNSTVDLVVNAGDGNDRIIGGAGDDQIEGAFGDDVAFLGSGNDSFAWDPGDGDDTFNGGSGTDTLEFEGSDDAELMTVTTLDNGGFRFFRDLGDITVDTRRVERVEVNALGGNDTIDGSAQTRSNVELEIDGGAGRDSLTGGAGRDSLMGDADDDSLTGEQGRDTFIFQPGTEDDRVLDFTDNNGAQDDRIDLSAYGFTDVGEINRGISGNDVVLSLGGGDTVRLVDYLANHALNDLQNNDFIF